MRFLLFARAVYGAAESRAAQAYPLDERHWLLGTAYNTGIECLQ